MLIKRVMHFVLQPMPWVQRLEPWLVYGYAVIVPVLSFCMYQGLYLVPADLVQGECFRIIYVHVPMAFLSLALYVLLGLCALLYSTLHIKSADLCAVCAAALGSVATFLAILTGAIWGKPTWGTWWFWDARLTSECVLGLMYVGYLATRFQLLPSDYAKKVASLLATLGLINVPIVHYSVQWWYTLHQPSTLLSTKSTMPIEMFAPLLGTIVAFMLLFAWMQLHAMIVVHKGRFLQSKVQYGFGQSGVSGAEYAGDER